MKKGLIPQQVVWDRAAAGQPRLGGRRANAAKGKEVSSSRRVPQLRTVKRRGRKRAPVSKGCSNAPDEKRKSPPTEANVKAIITAGGNGMPASATC